MCSKVFFCDETCNLTTLRLHRTKQHFVVGLSVGTSCLNQQSPRIKDRIVGKIQIQMRLSDKYKYKDRPGGSAWQWPAMASGRCLPHLRS